MSSEPGRPTSRSTDEQPIVFVERRRYMNRWDRRLIVVAWAVAASYVLWLTLLFLGFHLYGQVVGNARKIETATCAIEDYARRQSTIIRRNPAARPDAADELLALADRVRATGIPCPPLPVAPIDD